MEYDGYKVVLDLGYATLPRLLALCPDGAVDAAVIVTHQHPDHCVDLSGLARVRRYRAADATRVPLYCPPGVLDVLRALEPEHDPAIAFDVRELGPAQLGPFRLETVPLPHYVTNLGVRLIAPDLTVAYTGDSGPSARLSELADGADLFISDATLQGPSPTTSPRYVMTAAEAAAGAAGARRLLLTHFWPDSDREVSRGEAQAVFHGEVLVAEEGLVVGL